MYITFVSFCVESCAKILDFVQACHPTFPGTFPAIPAVFAVFHCMRWFSVTTLLQWLGYFSYHWYSSLLIPTPSLVHCYYPEGCTHVFQWLWDLKSGLFSDLCFSVGLSYQEPYSCWKGKQILISTNSICTDSNGESQACDYKPYNFTKQDRQTLAWLSN